MIMIFATIYVLSGLWGQLETWKLTLYIYYIIAGLSGVVIALWIAIDGKRLERYAVKIRDLEKKLNALEQKIMIIKPKNQEKE
ncbi:hypothetical protein MUO71_09020 [Candidatus Bathyarchaeota archaeon]|nr:hypothetical protein [Candidatus Bathyarchaeota archaeon]